MAPAYTEDLIAQTVADIDVIKQWIKEAETELTKYTPQRRELDNAIRSFKGMVDSINGQLDPDSPNADKFFTEKMKEEIDGLAAAFRRIADLCQKWKEKQEIYDGIIRIIDGLREDMHEKEKTLRKAGYRPYFAEHYLNKQNIYYSTNIRERGEDQL